MQYAPTTHQNSLNSMPLGGSPAVVVSKLGKAILNKPVEVSTIKWGERMMKTNAKLAVTFSAKRRGFTLVEILVAVAILAILAGLLFPAFSRARSSARTATCASNLKQIGLAFRLYVEDNRGMHPGKSALKDPNCDWPEKIYPYAKSTAVFSCPSFEYGEYRLGCPASSPTNDPDYTPAVWDGSYDLNYLGRGRFNNARIRRPSEMILFVDGTGKEREFTILKPHVFIDGVPIDRRDFSVLGDRHNYGANVAYADGHVKWKSYEDLLDIKQWQP